MELLATIGRRRLAGALATVAWAAAIGGLAWVGPTPGTPEQPTPASYAVAR